jgi:RNA polymerase sigma-70 factor (ECF subfamily)
MAEHGDALEACYRRHAGTVFRRARHLLGSEADAHEVVQDVFLSLFERPEQYAGQSSLVTFLYAATTHACLNRIRQRNNRARLLEQRMAPEEHGFEQRGMSVEERLRLHQALERMPEKLARVVVYAHVDGLTYEEIAELLGCSRRQVGKLLEQVAAWGLLAGERACGS